MTEIPEHLLKRAAERRAAKSGGGDAPAAGDAAAPAAAAPGEAVAPAAAEKPAKKQAPLPTLDAEPTPTVPDIAVVAAAKNRKRVPYWAASVLALLPLWAFIYVYAVTPPPSGQSDPLVIGKEVYAANGCQGCHGATGGGDGGGQVLADGHTIQTFKDPLAMVHWIAYGTEGGARDDNTYGDLDRPGGPVDTQALANNMPAFKGVLSPEEMAAVVIYIRQEFGGELYDPENEQGFTAEAFEADPAVLEAQVTAAEELPEGGDPEVTSIEREAE